MNTKHCLILFLNIQSIPATFPWNSLWNVNNLILQILCWPVRPGWYFLRACSLSSVWINKSNQFSYRPWNIHQNENLHKLLNQYWPCRALFALTSVLVKQSTDLYLHISVQRKKKIERRPRRISVSWPADDIRLLVLSPLPTWWCYRCRFMDATATFIVRLFLRSPVQWC